MLNDAGNALSASDTGRHNAIFLIQSFHVMQNLYCELAAGSSQGMPQSDGPSVDIHFLRIQSQGADDGE